MSDLANQVVAHYEQEASLSDHYLDTASLYKMLLHVPTATLQDYLFTIYGKEYYNDK